MASTSDFPAGYQLFDKRVENNTRGRVRNMDILKKTGTNQIVKMIKERPRRSCEEKFYRLIKGTLDEQYDILIKDKDCMWPYATIEDLDVMASLTPNFFGTESLRGDDYLVLEDVTFSYKYPAIMVAKMGQEDEDSIDDEMGENVGQSDRAKLGFELAGWQIYNRSGLTKEMGSDSTEDTIPPALKEFFSLGRKNLTKDIILCAVKKLEKIKLFFKEQSSFHLYGSSLLFLYEAEPVLPADVRIYMIGFSNVQPGYCEKDASYLLGLSNMINLLEELSDL